MANSLDLFIFVDALGWQVAERYQFLADILPHRSPCDTVFGYSSTCDPTILTGAEPRDHGHFSFFIKADPEKNPSPFGMLKPLSILPHRLAGYHRLRNRLSRMLGKHLGYTGYFQLYSVPFSKLPYLDYTEKQDIYEDGGIVGGQTPIFSLWEKSGKPWSRSDWRRPEDENIAEMRGKIDEGEIELGYLFTGSLDGTMHRFGTSGPEVEAAFDKLGSAIRDLYELANKRYDEVRFHVFSDHGMSDTKSASDLMLRWEKLGFRYGEDYVAVWDSTMARFWFHSDAVREKATQWLAEQDDGRIVPDEVLASWGCDFPGQKYGELFYSLPPGSIFVPSFLNQSFVPGMHGYDPSHPDCTASWLTNSEKNGVPKRLQDIFGVMRRSSQL